jgi:hypothetical protein
MRKQYYYDPCQQGNQQTTTLSFEKCRSLTMDIASMPINPITTNVVG